jgi:hypothetical protein
LVKKHEHLNESVYFTRMFYVLHHYLVQQQQLMVQGVGMLRLMSLPARYDVANQSMMAPMQRVKVEKTTPSNLSMQQLMGFIARQMQISEEDAFEQYSSFCAQVAQTLADTGAVEWPGLGRLNKQGQEVALKLLAEVDAYLPAASAQRVIKQGGSHAMTVGESTTTTTAMQNWIRQKGETPTGRKIGWWAAALLMALATGAAIIMRLLGKW